MGRYRHQVFDCTSGKTRPIQRSERVHTEFRRAVKDAGLKGVVRV